MKRIENFFRFDCRKFCNDLREKGLQQKEICEKISISESTLSNWISGQRTPRAMKYPVLKDVAEEYGLDFKVYLVKDDSPDKDKKALLKSSDLKITERHNTISWPIIGRAAGGPWVQALETSEYTTYADSYMPVSATYEDPNGYALTVVGNSMEPVLPEGTEIAVSPNRPARNGDVAVVFVQSDISDQAEVCVKRFYFNGANNDKVRLVSYNSDYPEIVLPATKILKTHRVVEWRVVVK